MKIFGIEDVKNYRDKSVVTLGFFDGVHKAHKMIIKRVIKEAKENNFKSVIITFEDEILNLFKITNNIQSEKQKLRCFEKLGVDYVLLLKKSDNFMSMDAFEFKEKCLDALNTRIIVCGSDFSFARNKEGNASFIKEKTDYKLIEIPDYYYENEKVSSTYIRHLLKDGNINLANALLFENFNIDSEVIKGKQIGRTIGFKTANLKVNNQCTLLKNGVYFGIATVDGNRYKTMVNVGSNPTISDESELKVEAYLLDFDKDIYDENINVEFLYFQRGESRFSSLEELKKRLEIDVNDLKHFSFN